MQHIWWLNCTLCAKVHLMTFDLYNYQMPQWPDCRTSKKCSRDIGLSENNSAENSPWGGGLLPPAQSLFDLPRHSWTLLNRFRTGQGPCRAKMHKWGLASSPLCDCGEQQTMEHIVDLCPLTKLDGGLLSLHEAEEDAISWL